MLNKAGIALSDTLTREDTELGNVYPSINHIREVSLKVAASVAQTAFSEGLARVDKPIDSLKSLNKRYNILCHEGSVISLVSLLAQAPK